MITIKKNMEDVKKVVEILIGNMIIVSTAVLFDVAVQAKLPGIELILILMAIIDMKVRILVVFFDVAAQAGLVQGLPGTVLCFILMAIIAIKDDAKQEIIRIFHLFHSFIPTLDCFLISMCRLMVMIG